MIALLSMVYAYELLEGLHVGSRGVEHAEAEPSEGRLAP